MQSYFARGQPAGDTTWMDQENLVTDNLISQVAHANGDFDNYVYTEANGFGAGNTVYAGPKESYFDRERIPQRGVMESIGQDLRDIGGKGGQFVTSNAFMIVCVLGAVWFVTRD